ncbi:MAG: hypothetical protein P8H38_00620 [Flavobacteriaceae bacterium]|nr:hypothetical protein [Flavobacteriaceae bacterium]
MKKRLLIIALAPLLLYSQKWSDRAYTGDGLVGISLGFLFEGQTQYPDPYYGPEVTGLYNDGAYHFILDIYFNRFIIGLQVSDEFLYLEKFDGDMVWKPRGFNQSFASLTRTYWISLGYNILNNFNLKFGIGLRRGPESPFTSKGFTASEVAQGFNYENLEVLYNTVPSLENFSEIDYSLSITYPIKVYGKLGVVPELGYTLKHGGLLTGISLIY